MNDDGKPSANVEFSATSDAIVVEDLEDSDDRNLESLNVLGESLGLPHDGNQPQTISERIAQVRAKPYSGVYPFPDSNFRSSLCPTSPEQQRRSRHLRLTDSSARYSACTWPWSLDASSSLMNCFSLQFGKTGPGALGSASWVSSPAETSTH